MTSKINVIVIVLDAVRADHLSSYGYSRETTPNIDKIASQGILYENAFSAAEWSPPSHASLFTGKYPSYHGTLGRNVFFSMENITIAEVLKAKGYETIGISGNGLIGSSNGFSKGFHRYQISSGSLRHPKLMIKNPRSLIQTIINGPDRFTLGTIEILRKTLRSRRDTRKPFFLFTNLFNCHAPYDPPNPFKRRFCSSFDESRLFILELIFSKILGRTTERFEDPTLDIKKLNYIASDEGQFAFMAHELMISDREWEIIKSWYDGEIAYLDTRIAEFINFLAREQMLDNTLLIITSDHGDSFGENGLASHHFSLSDNIIHVPLIIHYPALVPKGKRIRNLVSLVDIFPTILNVLGIKNNIYDIQGKTLYPFEERRIHEFICAECGKSVTLSRLKHIRSFSAYKEKVEKLDKGLKCLRTERYKYVLSSDGIERLFDLSKDPLEREDISHENVDILREFNECLKKRVDVSYFGPEEIPHIKGNSEIRERLQALGYM